MSTARAFESISEEEYLAGEEVSMIKHEFVAGRVYAITGARTAHNLIAANVLASFHGQLRGKPCRPFMADMKVRIQRSPTDVRHYYPDVVIACDIESLESVYQQEPVVFVEVLSDSTRRHDEGEKKEAYLTIPSLTHHVLLEQDVTGAIVYGREASGFERRIYTKLDDVIEIHTVQLTLSLADAYDGALAAGEE